MNKLEILKLLAKVLLGYFAWFILFGMSDELVGIIAIGMISLSIWGLVKEN